MLLRKLLSDRAAANERSSTAAPLPTTEPLTEHLPLLKECFLPLLRHFRILYRVVKNLLKGAGTKTTPQVVTSELPPQERLVQQSARTTS